MSEGDVLKVSQLDLPPEGVASSGISYDAFNLTKQIDEFAARHGRNQLGLLMHEIGQRHGLFVAISWRGDLPTEE